MEKNRTPTIKLNNNVNMPLLGLGTYRALGDEGKAAIQFALTHGYNMIDTAQAYSNEPQVGDGWIASGRTRGDIFITTKIRNGNQGYESTQSSFKKSLVNLQTDYVDLLLIHWPNIQDFNRTLTTWQAMIKLYKGGLCRSIGVSNFTIPLLKKLMDETEFVPAVNQVEFHAFLYQKELLDFCNEQAIRIEAYTPIARGKYLDHAQIKGVAEKYQKTPAQVMLGWCIQHSIPVIPKSVHKDRILENRDSFLELAPQDMEILDNLKPQTRLIDSPNAPPSW